MKSNTYLREKANKNKISFIFYPLVNEFIKDSSTYTFRCDYMFNNIHRRVEIENEMTINEYFEVNKELSKQNMNFADCVSRYLFEEEVIPAIEQKEKIKIITGTVSGSHFDGQLNRFQMSYNKI